jgi:FkbM family methyltransferase
VKQQLKLVTRAWRAAVTKLLVGRGVRALIVRSEIGLFAVDPEDYGVGRKLRKNGSYGRAELEGVRPYLTADSRVLVVGAHIGTLAIPLSRICREVVAIEANPATFDLLTMSIALNGASNCLAIHLAASDKEEELPFVLNRVNSGGSKRLPKIDRFMYHYDHPETIPVKAAALDRSLKDRSFQVVVMDIEGSEYFALRGMQDILARCNALMVEFLPHHLRYVSGVSVAQFLSTVEPHFARMTIPSRQLTVPAGGFEAPLTDMFDRDEGDSGLIFEKG